MLATSLPNTDIYAVYIPLRRIIVFIFNIWQKVDLNVFRIMFSYDLPTNCNSIYR